MAPTGLMNDQDQSRCYVNSSFQVHFLIYIFGQLTMNIDCDNIMKELDDSEY